MAAKSRRPLACTAEADAPVSSAVELHRSKNTPTQGRTKTLQGDVGHVQFGRERLHALVEDVRVRSDLADVLQSHARLRHEAVRLVEDVLAHHVHVLVLHHSTVNKNTHQKCTLPGEAHRTGCAACPSASSRSGRWRTPPRRPRRSGTAFRCPLQEPAARWATRRHCRCRRRGSSQTSVQTGLWQHSQPAHRVGPTGCHQGKANNRPGRNNRPGSRLSPKRPRSSF